MQYEYNIYLLRNTFSLNGTRFLQRISCKVTTSVNKVAFVDFYLQSVQYHRKKKLLEKSEFSLI